jgi:glycosyltransferase involved in cell wall biosynthesis
VAERFGLLTAIQALALIGRRIPGSTLRIHGKYDPSYKEVLAREVKRLGLEKQVALSGWLRPAQVCQEIREADIGLVPYLDNGFMNLAFSTKTFEYAATGLPVVASRLRSIGSVFDERAVRYAQPGDAGSMAEKVVELCLNPELRRRQAERALGSLAGISGAVMERRYVHLMKNLIGVNGSDGAHWD